MFPLYLKILALNIGLSNFVVLLVAFARGSAVSAGDFLFPVAIQFLLVTLIFIMLDLVRAQAAKAVVVTNTHDPRSTANWPVRTGSLRTFLASHTETRGFGAAKQNSVKG